MIKAIIIDDERLARNELRKLLADFPEIEVVAEAANANEGMEKIDNFGPELIFLDINMPGKTHRSWVVSKTRIFLSSSSNFMFPRINYEFVVFIDSYIKQIIKFLIVSWDL